MDLFLAICQALGIGLAVGIGGPLAAMFVATMAHTELGMNPEGTDWGFFASSGGVLAIFVVNVAAYYASRAGLAVRLPNAIFALLFGAVAGAASLAEEGESAAIGLVVGAAAGLVAGLIAGSVLEGAKQRAAADEEQDSAAGTLTLIFAAAGIAIAALALFLPPASLLVLIGLAILASGRRRKAGEKYEGLRVLR